MSASIRSLVLRLCTTGLLVACLDAQANIVDNGGFESGDFAPSWSVAGDTTFTGVDNGNSATYAPHGGTYEAFFGGSGTTLSQTLTTSANVYYSLKYFLALEADAFGAGGGTNSFSVLWNGQIVGSPLTNVATPFDFQEMNGPAGGLLATSGTSVLSFVFSNVPAFWDFDDVSVDALPPGTGGTTVPEPSSIALLGLAGAIGVVRSRRKRVA